MNNRFSVRRTIIVLLACLAACPVFVGCSESEKPEDPAAVEAARQEHISRAQREMEDIKNEQ